MVPSDDEAMAYQNVEVGAPPLCAVHVAPEFEESQILPPAAAIFTPTASLVPSADETMPNHDGMKGNPEGPSTVATVTAAPLDPPNEVTTTVREPTLGGVVTLRVRDMDVDEDTKATPLLNTTVLPAAVGSKPVPVIVSAVALDARLARLWVTVGAATTVATWTAVPLDPPKDVTAAVSDPRLVGCVDNVTFKDVAVAEVTAPKAPRLNATVLADGVVASKPLPAMVSVGAFLARLARLWVTVGGVGGAGVVVGTGVTVGAGVGVGFSGTRMFPNIVVCATPVTGLIGSAASGTAVTLKLSAEREDSPMVV